jgi:hypothetical protein
VQDRHLQAPVEDDRARLGVDRRAVPFGTAMCMRTSSGPESIVETDAAVYPASATRKFTSCSGVASPSDRAGIRRVTMMSSGSGCIAESMARMPG